METRTFSMISARGDLRTPLRRVAWLLLFLSIRHITKKMTTLQFLFLGPLRDGAPVRQPAVFAGDSRNLGSSESPRLACS
jgi:hypothetical protein